MPGIYKFHAIVTTFETIISDCEILSQIDWRICIIDEAHRLKNQKCKLIEGLRIFELEHKVLLTGTPLQVMMMCKGYYDISFEKYNRDSFTRSARDFTSRGDFELIVVEFMRCYFNSF